MNAEIKRPDPARPFPSDSPLIFSPSQLGLIGQTLLCHVRPLEKVVNTITDTRYQKHMQLFPARCKVEPTGQGDSSAGKGAAQPGNLSLTSRTHVVKGEILL